jgi:adenylate kinase family enzyme
MTTLADIPPLSALGRRIMVCGPSTAGKSTLAVAIGRKLDIPAMHVDIFRHLPDTDWVRRPDADFHRLHDEAIRADEWVMDGNYSELFPQRLQRATGIVLLGHQRIPTFIRYLRRTLFQKDRLGSVAGDRDSLKWSMVHWVLVASPRNLRRYREELPQTGLPFVEARGMRGLNALYAAWDLVR